MKKTFTILLHFLFFGLQTIAQDNISPAPEYKGLLFIKNGTIHVGNGQVLENTTIQVNNGKIEKIGQNLPIPADDVKVFDATGKQVYPGLILSNTNIGLREIGSQVKGSNDFREIGDINPNIRSIVAYNTDSKIINTLRSNGILLANIAPQGSLIGGSSSVVQFDAWTYEDAAYKLDAGMNFYMPSLMIRRNRRAGAGPASDPLKEALDRIETVKAFFRDAKAYHASTDKNKTINLKLEAVKNLFNKSQRLYIHCNIVKEMLIAIDFVKEFGFDVTIVGGSESFQIAPLLQQNNISVILQQLFSLPTSDDDDVDQPFKTPSILQQAGVLYSLTDEDGQTTGRNLMFNAGIAAANGLTKEQALQSITLNAAKILGIADRTGSIEVGKDANIVISTGDILDMKNSVVTHAFIQGRNIDLNDKHKELNEKYKKKYGIK